MLATFRNNRYGVSGIQPTGVVYAKVYIGYIRVSRKPMTQQHDITGIVKQYNHKLLAINGMPDHIHILIGKRPTQSESDLMELVKASSSKWINQRQFLKSHFAWQEGFGAFSYTKSHVDSVIGYIRKQKEHHSGKETFIEEYLRILTELDMDFDERYIFKDLK